jgi:hypothetical protein
MVKKSDNTVQVESFSVSFEHARLQNHSGQDTLAKSQGFDGQLPASFLQLITSNHAWIVEGTLTTLLLEPFVLHAECHQLGRSGYHSLPVSTFIYLYLPAPLCCPGSLQRLYTFSTLTESFVQACLMANHRDPLVKSFLPRCDKI